LRNINQGAAQPNLNTEIIKDIVTPLPPFEEQNEIVRRVEELFKFADAVEERYKKAKAHTDKLSQSILAKAFRGELVPQDPNDEPAADLLERVMGQGADKEKKNRRVRR
jgi:type I restriction enzyme S subunit